MSRRLLVLPVVALLALGALAASAAAQVTPSARDSNAARHAATPSRRQPAKVTVKVKGLKHHHISVGERLAAVGRITPYVPHQIVHAAGRRQGARGQGRRFHVTEIGHSGVGRFHIKTPKLSAPGPYRVSAIAPGDGRAGDARSASRSRSRIQLPRTSTPATAAATSSSSPSLLREAGLLRAPHLQLRRPRRAGRSWPSARSTAWSAPQRDAGDLPAPSPRARARFKLKYPNAGNHVEVDISRQVMVLADHGKAAVHLPRLDRRPGDADDHGPLHVLPQGPGLQLEGMYYSSYWHGGYAIHGYARCRPTTPATAACATRSPTRSSSTTGSRSGSPSTPTARATCPAGPDLDAAQRDAGRRASRARAGDRRGDALLAGRRPPTTSTPAAR